MVFRKFGLFNFFVCIFVFRICTADVIPFSISKKKEFVLSHGYPFEVYSIETPDGYILELERMPFGKNSPNQPNVTRPTVLLMAGLWCDSSFWLASGPNNSLPFMLADQGYDVWMGNNRGTYLSRKHRFFNPHWDSRYWDFSIHQLGIYDLQEIVNHILANTSSENITYIGYSQGAALLLILASEMPEYNSKFNMFIAIAPAVYISPIKSELTSIGPYLGLLRQLSKMMHTVELFQYSNTFARIFNFVCGKDYLGLHICNNVIERVFGSSNDSYDISLLLQHYPAGSSLQQARHFSQLHLNGRFSQYDYDDEELNIIKYGQLTPPDYQLEKVSIPTVIYYSKSDYISSEENVNALSSAISSVFSIKEITDVSHLTIIVGNHANTKLFNPLIDFLKTN